MNCRQPQTLTPSQAIKLFQELMRSDSNYLNSTVEQMKRDGWILTY